MKKLIILLTFIFIVSCAKDPDLIVKGQVKGLKKGTVYLEKEQDSSIIIVDSIFLNGPSEFELKSDLISPEAFYLWLSQRRAVEPPSGARSSAQC